MGIIDANLVSSESMDNIKIIITDFDKLSKEDKWYIKNNLVEISKGKDSYFDVETVAKKLKKFFDKHDYRTKIGAGAELLMASILRSLGFEQEYCYKNLEENSIKKGFDGVFVAGSELWIAESKSTGNFNSHRNKHNTTISRAYNGIVNMLSGKTDNDPWENATTHARVAMAEKNLLKQLTYLSTQYTKGDFQDVNETNIVIVSTIYSSEIENIEKATSSIEECIKNHSALKEIVLVMNVSDISVITDYIEELSNER